MSRTTQDKLPVTKQRFVYGIVTLCDQPFQIVPLRCLETLTADPTTPMMPKHHRFGLLPFRSPLLGESLVCFLFLQVLRCFSSPRSPPFLKNGWYDRLIPGCPIRKSADRFVFANTRSLSQLIASFIAFRSLGILHVPLSNFFSSLAGIRKVSDIKHINVARTDKYSALFLLFLLALLFFVYCRHVKDRYPKS